MMTVAGRLIVITLLTGAIGMVIAPIGRPAFAAKLTDKEHTRIDYPRPADLPPDSALEAAGAVIGTIELNIRNIFDESDPRENNGLFRAANHLHIRTKHATVQAQLLFASGDKYSARRLAETERALRLLPYVYDARVLPVRYSHGKVDLLVITKDVWTLSPGISFGRSGGTNDTRFNLQDTNFLGWGKTLQVSHGSTVDRTSNTVEWIDPNVFGSRWISDLTYANSSDGSTRSLLLSRPFFALDAPWSVKIKALKFDRAVSRYNLGNIVDEFDDRQSAYELSGGLSRGQLNDWIRRLTFGMRYDRNVFAPTPRSSLPARVLPPDRTLSYPFVGFDILQDKYQKIGDENQIGRTEDLYFGTEVSGEVGINHEVFGADRNGVVLQLKVLRGIELARNQQLFLTNLFSTRIEGGRSRNLIADVGAKYYWRWRPDWLLYAGISGTVTNALDPEMQLLLGGDNGLRGYPLRYESGTSRALLTVEQRVFTDWFPFRLARVGGAIFADVGRTWGSGSVGNSDPGTLKDVGFGLRFGNSRTGLGNVLHIDFAFPLNHSSGIRSFQFLVQTLQSY